MRMKFGTLDLEIINPRALEGRTTDLAALQRETRWKLSDVQAMCELEGPALAMAVFFTMRAAGRLISYAKAEELLDEIEFVQEPGDVPDEDGGADEAAGEDGAEDPTPAPTVSGRGDDEAEPEPEPSQP